MSDKFVLYNGKLSIKDSHLLFYPSQKELASIIASIFNITNETDLSRTEKIVKILKGIETCIDFDKRITDVQSFMVTDDLFSKVMVGFIDTKTWYGIRWSIATTPDSSRRYVWYPISKYYDTQAHDEWWNHYGFVEQLSMIDIFGKAQMDFHVL